MMKVYHLGYAVPGAEQTLETLMQDAGVHLIDTRYKPYSRIPGWVGSVLGEKYGARYHWAGAYLGNLHYKGGPILLANTDVGIRGLCTYLSEGKDLILLCGCKDYERCHRKVIIELLQQQMPEVAVIHPEQQSRICTVKCLSIRQPYAHWLANPHLFINAGIRPKVVENRDWTTRYRGPLFIHASKACEEDALDYWERRCPELRAIVPQDPKDYVRGAIIGRAALVDVVSESDDPWFCGEYGFVLADAYPIEPVTLRGQLKLFDVEVCHCCSMPVTPENSARDDEGEGPHRLCFDCIK